MLNYDLTSPAGQQAFQRWVVQIIRNEINSYIQQVLFDRNAINITTPTVTDINPNTGNAYNPDEIRDLRLERLEQATFRR
jgi:hypothetical protein